VTCIHPQCARIRPVCLQAHLVLETLLLFRLILYWTTLPYDTLSAAAAKDMLVCPGCSRYSDALPEAKPSGGYLC